eukprot:TRINITY_DN279_c0_g2_i2.p1 TRINITY_DN279_c0_g2~~TRINITY_DN279_c0_g2_i2.p1  ORF type:complete len:213 (-),score=19.99 TRINITY_DN279_c0_g2_i2:681-1319(-)
MSNYHLRGTEEVISGAVAGGIARAVVAPLDLLKVRFQLQTQSKHENKYRSLSQAFKLIKNEESIWALWKGNLCAEFLVSSYCAAQFLAYRHFKTFFQGRHFKSKSWNNWLGGAYASLFATTVTYPFDLLRTRLAAQQAHQIYHGIFGALKVILNQNGVLGLFHGYWPTIVGICPYMGTQFALYGALKRSNAVGCDQSSVSVFILYFFNACWA